MLPFPCPQTPPALAGGRRRRHGRNPAQPLGLRRAHHGRKVEEAQERSGRPVVIVSRQGTGGGSVAAGEGGLHDRSTPVNGRLRVERPWRPWLVVLVPLHQAWMGE
jgi:hypothetical protein